MSYLKEYSMSISPTIFKYKQPIYSLTARLQVIKSKWSMWQDSNLRHLAPKASALPNCATHGNGAPCWNRTNLNGLQIRRTNHCANRAWRRWWDSDPRQTSLPAGCFQDSSLKPLGYISKIKMGRITGIEPVNLAWKARVLPLNYIRIMVRAKGIEPLR